MILLGPVTEKMKENRIKTEAAEQAQRMRDAEDSFERILRRETRLALKECEEKLKAMGIELETPIIVPSPMSEKMIANRIKAEEAEKEQRIRDAEDSFERIMIRETRKEEEKYKKIIAEKDLMIAERKKIIAEKDLMIAERKKMIAEKDLMIAEKDQIIAEKEKEKAALKKQIEELGKK